MGGIVSRPHRTVSPACRSTVAHRTRLVPVVAGDSGVRGLLHGCTCPRACPASARSSQWPGRTAVVRAQRAARDPAPLHRRAGDAPPCAMPMLSYRFSIGQGSAVGRSPHRIRYACRPHPPSEQACALPRAACSSTTVYRPDGRKRPSSTKWSRGTWRPGSRAPLNRPRSTRPITARPVRRNSTRVANPRRISYPLQNLPVSRFIRVGRVAPCAPGNCGCLIPDSGAVPQAQSDVPLMQTRRPVGTALCPLDTARRRYFRASGSNDRARRWPGDRVPSH